MMAEVTVSWLLLDGAITAHNAMLADISQSETKFYQGKITSAQFYINNILPNVFSTADIIALEDESAVNADITTFIP